MLPKHSARSLIFRIARKEIELFFATPIAYLFLATFAAATLFIFFWGESFFARNIADVRPLFEWMPVLLIFLASTLTMRLWSEERRTGTLEHVLTLPAPLWHFVAGKFLGCLVLLVLALAITLPLPLTVAWLGELDWGPVWSGYIATLLLGGAYLSIGLFVSSRSDNQIVSLISAAALCGFFYLIGNPAITDFLGHQVADWLRLLGSGSRFESITRGVIDIRDLYYYVSLIVIFLVLNTYTLERQRWSQQPKATHHKQWHIVSVLVAINVLAANVWLSPINTLRVDTTAGNQYSISASTHNYLARLDEPLLLRGYFSSKTHPLLSPLVPQLKNLMQEYEIAGNGRIRVEFIDPLAHPELEEEAYQKFGIEAMPFQIADRYQSSIVSSYFNVLVKYGDQHQVLNFEDLIEVHTQGESDIDVQLRNPEHDLTRAVKKVLQAFQAGGNLFDTLKQPLVFTAYASPDERLPEPLIAYRDALFEVVKRYQQDANGLLNVQVIDPEAGDGHVARQIAEEFGFQPMATSMLSETGFYFYLTLSNQQQVVPIPLEDATEASFERNLKAAIQRFGSGFTKTVALVTPPINPNYAQYGIGTAEFRQLQRFLGEDLNVQKEDLSDGLVSGDADILLLASPKELDNKALFAVDQFLMQGGTVIAATSPYSTLLSSSTIILENHRSGLEKWLAHHGITIEKQLVMDPQNASFPLPVTRNIGGFQMREIRMLDYPYFIDVRSDGLNQSVPVTSDLLQATLVWASPIRIDEDTPEQRTNEELIHSSEGSWLSSRINVMPNLDEEGRTSYEAEGDTGRHPLAIVSTGRFDSFFADKPSPLINAESSQEESAADTAEIVEQFSQVIKRSPDSARIILFGSNDFLRDDILGVASSSVGSEYLNTLELVANAIDWSLADASLLSIRSRGHFNRTLPPLDKETQVFWEYLNYALAAFALLLIALIQRQVKRARARAYLQWFAK